MSPTVGFSCASAIVSDRRAFNEKSSMRCVLDCRRVPLLWTAYILMPAGSWGLLRGVPIGLGGAVVLFAVWWTWRYHHLLPSRSVLVALLLLKLISGLFLSVERGLEADYFANTEWTPPIERSTDFRSRSFTRVDSRLSFGAPDGEEFPLYFFDASGRSTQPFSAVWRGFVRESRPEDRRAFYLKGSGVDGEFWVDGAQTVHLNPESDEAVDRARWPAGLRRLTVRLRVPPGAAHRFEAGFIDAAGRKHPLDGADVTARAYSSWRVLIGRGHHCRKHDRRCSSAVSSLWPVRARRAAPGCGRAMPWLWPGWRSWRRASRLRFPSFTGSRASENSDIAISNGTPAIFC